MEDAIQAEYKAIQQERARIDAERDQWLRHEAQPFLDAIEEQLLATNLPDEHRQEYLRIAEELRTNAYFRNLVSTPDAAQLLGGKDVSWIRELARDGRIGKKVGGTYIHSTAEISHFVQKPREVGKHRKKDE